MKAPLPTNQWINFVDVILITPILAIVFYRAGAFKWLQGGFGYFLGEMFWHLFELLDGDVGGEQCHSVSLAAGNRTAEAIGLDFSRCCAL
jgi:hypothetical protein